MQLVHGYGPLETYLQLRVMRVLIVCLRDRQVLSNKEIDLVKIATAAVTEFQR